MGSISRFKMCDWYKVQETKGNRSLFKKCHSFNDKLPILTKKKLFNKNNISNIGRHLQMLVLFSDKNKYHLLTITLNNLTINNLL